MSLPASQTEPARTAEPSDLDKRISDVVSNVGGADPERHAPSESSPAYVWLPVVGAIVYAQLALAWQHGFSLERVLGSVPKPWSTLLKLLCLSFALYVAKAPLLEHGCSRLLGFTQRRTWNTRWTADNYHLLSTLVGVWVVVFGTEADGPLGIVPEGVYVFSTLAYMVLATFLNIYYNEAYYNEAHPSLPRPLPAAAAGASPAPVTAPAQPVMSFSANATTPKA